MQRRGLRTSLGRLLMGDMRRINTAAGRTYAVHKRIFELTTPYLYPIPPGKTTIINPFDFTLAQTNRGQSVQNAASVFCVSVPMQQQLVTTYAKHTRGGDIPGDNLHEKQNIFSVFMKSLRHKAISVWISAPESAPLCSKCLSLANETEPLLF